MRELISIIIPIYKVEKYLLQCIESVLKQTYKNIEIILVDDGSPDNCGKICDDYAAKDSRIVVIHKENGGLSSARNAGIDICKGKYISFIDSDDFVSPLFIEMLYKGIKYNNADISSLTSYVGFFDGNASTVIFSNNVNDIKLCEVSPYHALEMLLYQRIPNAVQFRLYKREIFNDIRFPVGYLFEDVATVHKTFIKSKKIVLIDADLYAYRVRQDSIVRMSFSEEKMIAISISKNLLEDICNYNLSLRRAAISRAFALNYQVFLQVPLKKREYLDMLWKEIIKYRKSVLTNISQKMRNKNRFAAFISLFGKRISHYIGRKIVYGKQKKI